MKTTIALTMLFLALSVLCSPALAQSIHIDDYGASADNPTNDDTAAFNSALAYAKLNGVKEIQFGKGSYTFKTQPVDIDFGVTLRGHGKGRTVLRRDYNSAKGFLTFVGGAGSSSVNDLGIVASAASSGGHAILLIGTNAGSPDWMTFTNLYLSTEGNNNWSSTVFIDGRARTNSPIGVRDIDFTNCSVFGATYAGIVLEGVVSFTFTGGGIFGAGGTSGKVNISGSSQMPSYYVNIDSSFIDGILMQYSLYGNFRGYFSAPITTSSNSQYNLVIGHVNGGVQPYWQNSKHVSPLAMP